MNLYNLKWKEGVRFSVEDVIDYNIIGTFNPNAECDTEFFGHRETTFNVTTLEIFYNEGGWWPLPDEELHIFKNEQDDQITLIVQNAIDDKQGEM